MTNFESIIRFGRPKLVLLALLACLHGNVVNAQPAQPGAETDDKPHPEESRFPQSVFTDDINSGKDPFFPRSMRRTLAMAPVKSDKPTKDVWELISLKGISGPAGGRLAIINNKTFATGEVAEVNTSAGRVKVRCVEVTENSVIIMIEGHSTPRELRMREAF